MYKHIAAVCGAIAITGMTVTAQAPQPSPTQPQTPRPKATQPDTPKTSRGAGESMTVSGCVASADASGSAGRANEAPGRATSTAAKAGAATKYVLTNVQHSGGTAKPATGASATQQPFALKTEGSTVDLSKHLNHKVELTGTLDTSAQRAPQVSSTGTSGSTGTATPGRDAAALQMPAATLNVTALKMVSATCP